MNDDGDGDVAVVSQCALTVEGDGEAVMMTFFGEADDQDGGANTANGLNRRCDCCDCRLWCVRWLLPNWQQLQYD